MVIQSFNVQASSHRTSLSISSSTGISAANEQHSAQFAGKTGQGGNQNGQGQNVNNQGNGNNGNGQGNNGNTGLGQNGGNNGNVGLGQNGNNPGNVGLGQNGGNNGNIGLGQNKDKEEVFKDALKSAKQERDDTIDRMARPSSSRHASRRGHKTPTSPQELRARLSQLIYEMLSGRGMIAKPPQVEGANGWRDFGLFNFGGIFGVGAGEQPQGLNGVRFEHFEFESETVSYQAQGVVHTADGRTINVDINMHVSRQFASYMNISTNSSTLVDPIVINYGGTAASLTGEKFEFDLTMDGNMDTLAMLNEGSGFLAIDWNGDGKINDGSQLFGPSTGCGFNELRKYDTDGNGWIDSNDEIFDKLVVWRRDADGNDTVKTLRELGIGAIFLGDISTEFTFTGDNNETLGVMRSTSFFIKECGGAGTLSHIDLAL